VEENEQLWLCEKEDSNVMANTDLVITDVLNAPKAGNCIPLMFKYFLVICC
jgi:hypothetical protein